MIPLDHLKREHSAVAFACRILDDRLALRADSSLTVEQSLDLLGLRSVLHGSYSVYVSVAEAQVGKNEYLVAMIKNSLF